MFTVRLRRPFDFEKWVNQWVNQLSEKQLPIIENIHRNNEIKKSELQGITGFSTTALDNNIEILKNEGFLEREGTKGGYCILHYIFP